MRKVHQRLKILSKPCQNKDLPMTQWLQSPGAMHNNLVRFQKLWSELNSKHNQAGHTYYILLLEPEKLARIKNNPTITGGYGVRLAWMQRQNNPTTKCIPTANPPAAPQWVLNCQINPEMLPLTEPEPISQPVQVELQALRRRIVGKQSQQTISDRGHDRASSSSMPRTGVG